MNNKDKIEKCLKELTLELIKYEDFKGIQALRIAEKLNLRRNVVSHYLNLLVTEDKVIKIKSRPVYFLHKEVVENYEEEKKREGTLEKYIEDEYKNFIDILLKYNEKQLSMKELRHKITIIMNTCLSHIVYNEKYNNDILESIYLNTVTNTLKIINESYGIRYYGSTSKVLSRILLFFSGCNRLHLNLKEELKNKLEDIEIKDFSREYIITEKILRNVSNNLGFHEDFSIKLFITLYIFTLIGNKNTEINGIIISNGYSTGSSIASAVNKYFGDFIFDAIDMPMGTSLEETIKLIKSYIDKGNNNKDTIILVDMKSLLPIGEKLKELIKGNILVVNNITTEFVINISKKIIEGESFNNIRNFINDNSKTEYEFIKFKNKKRAILTTCISGLGTSVKIKELLSKVLGDSGIDIIPYEYGNLANRGIDDEIFKEYDIKLIISTTDLKIDGINCILLEDLVSSNNDYILDKVLLEFLEEDKIEYIKKDLTKIFSLQNVMNQLSILNPNKIINDVEKIILKLENSFNVVFSSYLRMLLYIHISVMIERLILNHGLNGDPSKEKEYIKNNKYIIKSIEDSFIEIEEEYNFSLTIKEIEIIQEIIENSIGKLIKVKKYL